MSISWGINGTGKGVRFFKFHNNNEKREVKIIDNYSMDNLFHL